MMRRICSSWLAAALIVGLFAVGPPTAHAADRPNIVLIMVDDMGFSDLGCYGGEIDTPQLDQLAADGVRFTQFYNNAKCETTRASLLSGQYHTEVGTQRLRNCVTIAEVLRDAGYSTYMSGKWHLRGNPVERGFERYFGHLSGATNFFTGNDSFRLDDQPFDVPQEGFYTTHAFTDYALQFLDEAPDDKPFFLYLAYNAPHYPLQAPKQDVEKYRGKYRMGWDKLREQRYERQLEMGVIPSKWELSAPHPEAKSWDKLSDEQKDREDLQMATYAAMIDIVDQSIARLISKLDAMEATENTLIFFLSDNGACPFDRTRNGDLMPWNPKSYWCYHQAWANACNTPLRWFKQNQHEGGISTPLIVHWPQGVDPEQRGRITRQPGHLFDIMATCIELAGADYPARRGDETVQPMRGKSLAPIFQGKEREPHEQLFFQFRNNSAVRMGDWKLVRARGGPWELYNLDADRTELHDLASQTPERVKEMAAAWRKWAEETGGR